MKRLILTTIVLLSFAAVATLVYDDIFFHVIWRVIACLLAATVFQLVVYLLAQHLQRLDLADSAWGLTFIVIAVTGFLLQDGYRVQFGLQTMVTVMVVVWGLRLSWHIGRRFLHASVQDVRYTELSKSWRYPRLQSLFLIFLLQALLAVVISIPVVHVNLWQDAGETVWSAIGFFVWLLGMVYEVTADWQLEQFLKNPHHAPLLTTGLRRYSRYPNYFGELCIWWGITLVSLGTPHGWVGLIGALTITYLLLYVSGVPLAEKSGRKKSGWASYATTTSLLLPLPPKR